MARNRDDGLTLEVTRLTVLDGERHVCSFLYGAAARVDTHPTEQKMLWEAAR